MSSSPPISAEPNPGSLSSTTATSVTASLTSSPSSSPDESPIPSSTPPHFLADLYTFKGTDLDLRLPLVSAAAVGLCLAIGIAVNHPSGGLIAGGGAFTIGLGANQRIADSRLLPMLVAIFACGSAALIGTIVGHHGYALVLAACGSAFIYGVLTAQNTGLAWVGQQASVALFVASAFPGSLKAGFIRASLILAGGAAQLLITSIGLRLLPELQKNLLALPRTVYHTLAETLQIRRHDLLTASTISPRPSRASPTATPSPTPSASFSPSASPPSSTTASASSPATGSR